MIQNLTKISSHLSLLGIILLILVACRNGVEDRSQEQKQSIEVESLSLSDIQNISQTSAASSAIEKKYYTVRACLVESALRQKMDGRKVSVRGTQLKSPRTDTAGCIYWEHEVTYDYSGINRCLKFQKTITLQESQHKIDLNYTIDSYSDRISDLSRSRGCLLQREKGQNALETPHEQIVVEEIKLLYVGETSTRKSDLRYKQYDTKLSTCLKYRLSNSPIANTSIKISITDTRTNKTIKISNPITDDRGCFTKDYNSTHEHYKYSHWETKRMDITLQEGPLKGTSLSQNFYANPWEADYNLFGIDPRYGSTKRNPFPKYNKLHIDGVMYIQIGNDIENFKVNNYLGLAVSKTYQVILSPKVDRGHLFSPNTQRYTKLRDGKFKLKFMILAPEKANMLIDKTNYKNFDYITGVEKEVEVKDGVINALVNLPIRLVDLPRLATRAISILKLEPLQNTGLRPTTVTGFFKAKIAWIRTNVIQSKILQTEEKEYIENYSPETHNKITEKLKSWSTKGISLEEGLMAELEGLKTLHDNIGERDRENLEEHFYKRFIEQHFAKITQTTKQLVFGDPKIFLGHTPRSIFTRHLKKELKNITTQVGGKEKPKDFVPLSEKAITSLYDKGFNTTEENRDLIKNICRKIFPKKNYHWSWLKYFDPATDTNFQSCQRRPQDYFEMSRFMHSVAIEKTTPLYSNGFNFYLGSRFVTNYNESYTEYLSKRVGADMGFKLPFGEFFGAGIRLFDISYTWSDSTSSQTNFGDDLSAQKQIVVEKFNIEVAGQFEKCVLLRGKKYLPTDYRTHMALSAGFDYTLIPEEFEVKLDKNFYFCTKPNHQNYKESWYFIQAYVHDTTLLRDSYGPTEIKFLKVIRNTQNFSQFEQIFRDKTKVYLIQKESATETPDIKLYESWGHLINTEEEPSAINKIMINNIEGSFPGTIKIPNRQQQ